MDSKIEIRTMKTLADCIAAEQLQEEIWQMEPLETVSAHTIHALVYNGASLLGAYDGQKLVGFVLGVLGLIDPSWLYDSVSEARLKMYSVMAGVSPAYQKQGVGYHLKMAQREAALDLGLRLITWTYDPLEGVNARLNVTKLGVVCRHYIRDFHGEMGGINAGLKTDRFEVEWWIAGNRVKGRAVKPKRPLSLSALIGGGALVVNPTTMNEDGFPVPSNEVTFGDSNLVLVEIPAHFQTMKQQDMPLAQQWRSHTRYLFEDFFRNGYLVTDFVHDQDDTGYQRSFYLLTHQDS